MPIANRRIAVSNDCRRVNIRSRSILYATAMFNRLLPQRIDNASQGRTLALWPFAVLVTVKILQCLSIPLRHRLYREGR
jgi:hypothetical protein